MNESLLQLIRSDIQRYYPRLFLGGAILRSMLNAAFLNVLLYRIAHKLYLYKMTPISSLIMFAARILFASDISYKARIGKGFLLAHGCSTVIGSDVKIGSNSFISQCVTIGSNFDRFAMHEGIKISQPIIGDDCFILAGAKVVGPVVVRNRCIIGANSVVTASTEENSIYVGAPAKRVRENRRSKLDIGGEGISL